MKSLVTVFCSALLLGCVSLPDAVTPVTGFELNRYLGTWYEIARLDHSFERGLSRVTAEYSLREDGGVSVQNRGFNAEENQWQDATGKAYFVGNADTGHLKVSFFGPFYGSYAIFDLDKTDYQYAFVAGPNTDYLWLLARSPTVSDTLKSRFRDAAAARGFDTDALIFVSHDEVAS